MSEERRPVAGDRVEVYLLGNGAVAEVIGDVYWVQMDDKYRIKAAWWHLRILEAIDGQSD
jgi:hypothetical protein